MRLELDPDALEDLNYWERHDKKKLDKVLKLIEAVLAAPAKGIGKPEMLKHNMSGCWSRRIDKEHRLIYTVKKDTLVVLSCRYHYKN